MTHCWQGKADWAEEVFGEYSPEHMEAMDHDGTCMLPDGHDGPHDFTPDAKLTIKFPPATAGEE